jgi:hypothetical protein
MVEDLDPPMRVRTTIDERGAASAANPAALDDVSPFEFLGNRCNYGEGLSRRLHAAPVLSACGVMPYADTTYCLTR